ncbi:uncharacterized protein DMENIID0001_127880 [Sergentomyia squamirostris]
MDHHVNRDEDFTASSTNLLGDIDDQEDEQSTVSEIPERKTPFLTVEPAILIIFFGWNLASPVFTNLVVYQTCTVLLGFNESDCRQLGTADESEFIQNLEQQVQPYTAKIIMVRSMIEQIVPAICSLFLGPWSDKFGRKPLLYACFAGYFCVYLILSILAFVSTKVALSPWFYILAYGPVMLSGGTCALITGVFCTITDVTTEKNRAIRMGIIEGVLFAGLFLGSISSSYILQLTNSSTVFAISALACLSSLLYVVFFLAETVKINEEFQGSKFRELFRFDHVCDMVKTSFKARPHYRRAIIWLAIFGLVMSLSIGEGLMTVFFLFTRAKFGWTIREYTVYESVSIVVMICGSIAALWILKKIFRMSDAMLASLAYASDTLQNFVRTLATRPRDLYIGVGFGILKSISGPMGRAVISNVTPPDEIGRVFSLVTALESISPIGSAPLYTMIYSNTIATFPSAFNAVSTAGCFLCLITMLVAYILEQGLPHVPYTQLIHRNA